jgi:hypothetical protein
MCGIAYKPELACAHTSYSSANALHNSDIIREAIRFGLSPIDATLIIVLGKPDEERALQTRREGEGLPN